MPKRRKKQGWNEKGLGSLRRVGRFYHLRITVDGVLHQHPTKKETLADARAERDRFLKDVLPGLRTPDSVPEPEPEPAPKPVHETITIAELISDYMSWKRDNATDAQALENVREDQQRLQKHIVSTFGHRLAASITSDDLKSYRKARKEVPPVPEAMDAAAPVPRKKGAMDATINWELSRMRAALKYGMNEQTPQKVLQVPHFPIVKLNNARRGFIEFEQYRTLLDAMCDTLKLFFVLAFHTGCRSGELIGLKWPQVNFHLGHIELQKTKNGHERFAPLYGDMRRLLEQQLALRNQFFPRCEYVLFWHQTDIDGLVRNQPGDRLLRFGKMWKRAVRQAGHPDLLPHDLRRTASRNMVQYCGLTEGQAMDITGHLTRNQFDRYNIQSLKSNQEAGAKLDNWFHARTLNPVVETNLRPVPVLAEPPAVPSAPAPLSMKQQVRQLYMAGLSGVEIARQLQITPATVNYHIHDHAKAATLARNREHKRAERLARPAAGTSTRPTSAPSGF